MKEQLVTHRVACLAKEKGFFFETPDYYDKENPLAAINLKRQGWGGYESWYTEDKVYPEDSEFTSYQLNPGVVYAPTQSYLQKWLRDVHGVTLIVKVDPYGDYQVEIQKILLPNGDFDFYDGFETYEEALEKGLQVSLRKIER